MLTDFFFPHYRIAQLLNKSFVGPVRLERTTLRLKAGYSFPVELRTNVVAAVGLEPTSEAYETSELAITLNHIW